MNLAFGVVDGHVPSIHVGDDVEEVLVHFGGPSLAHFGLIGRGGGRGVTVKPKPHVSV